MSSEGEGSATATTNRRTSGRQSKPIQRLADQSVKGKSKYVASDDSQDSEVDELESESEAGSEVPTPKKTPKSSAKGKGKAKESAKAKGKKATAPRKRKTKELDEEDEEGDGGPVVTKGDLLIFDDNDLFNSVRNPNASLESVVDDWVVSYKTDAGPAMAELINCILRSSGCNSTIDEHQAEDENGVVEVLDDINAEFKDATLLAYPLISKSKELKKFRGSLQSFLSHLFDLTASTGVLYDTSFCQVFQSWLTSLSSSKIRSFRHTATVISLASVSALCEVAIVVNKEFASASRAKEAEHKKARKDKSRLRDLERTVEEVHERKTKLEEYLTDLFEAVFVHRYRDSDPTIRSECIKALGEWMKVYPDYWLEGNYLRYIGWVLSDDHKDVRHESIKALIALYAKDDQIGSMQHFTERFKGQIVRMATSEVDLSVRISCIHVLQSINLHGLLEDEQRDEIAKLIFEEERRVRQAVAAFFSGILDESVADKETELEAAQLSPSKKRRSQEGETDRLKFKCIAELLVRYSVETDDSAVKDEDGEAGEAEREELAKKLDTNSLDTARIHRGRIALAVEALWEQVESIRDWEAMMEFLLLDHSSSTQDHANADSTPNGKSKGAGKKTRGRKSNGAEEDFVIEEAARLTEDEETLLVEVLVASLGRATGSSAAIKKEKVKDDDVLVEITRTVIEVLPRLFAKHQIIPARIVDILAIPRLIKLESYVDMRKVSAYESLWDDVTKQLLNYTDADVIDQALTTIKFFLETTVLANSNDSKIMTLEDTLVNSLRDVVARKDVESSGLDEDEVATLTALAARIIGLFKIRDISASLDETDEGKQSSGIEIINSMIERGRLGYKEEGKMVEHAITISQTYITWRIRRVGDAIKDYPEEAEIASIVEDRQSLLNKLEDLCVGTGSNAVEGVKRVALSNLLILYILSSTRTAKHADPRGDLAELKMVCSDELQARAAGFVEAEMERYSEAMAELLGEDLEAEDDDTEESSDDENTKKKKKAKKPKTKKTISLSASKRLAKLLNEEHFGGTVSPFVQAIHLDVIDIRHASVILGHSDQFGPYFDQFAKLLAQDLKDEAIYGARGDLVARIIFDAFRDAADRFLLSSHSIEESMISLSKVLASATYSRGAHLAISAKIGSEHHVKIHTDIGAYIARKISNYDEADQKERKAKAIFLFKPLSNLLIGVDGKSALKIKNALDIAINIPVSAKPFEAARAYQRRLLTLASKDPSIKLAAVKAKSKSKKAAEAAATSDQEQDNDNDDVGMDIDGTPPAIMKKAAPAAAARARKILPGQPTNDTDSSEEEQDTLPARKNLKKPAKKSYGTAAQRNSAATAGPKVDSDDSDNEIVAEVEEVVEVVEEIIEDVEESEEDDERVEELLLSSQPRSQASKKRVSEPVEEDVSDVESVMSISDIKRKNKKARR